MSSSNEPSDQTQQTKYLHHLKWESSVPERVSIKGSFDQWKSSLELQKKTSGKFSAPIELEFGSKVSYKYVVDGTWRHNPNEPTETDSSGNVNNVFQVPQHPSFSMNPEVESARTLPNPVQTMSSAALAEESIAGTSTDANLSKTPEHDNAALIAALEHVSRETNPSLNYRFAGFVPAIAHCSTAESPAPPDMSIAFPSTSTDNLPELTQRPKPAVNTKRTLSLFAPGTRFGRASHRTQSLATAPGTPKEKASPAGASVSNVVSAMAGVAATAIPAAIFAVTGKDITRNSKAESPAASPSGANALSTSAADDPSTTSQSPANGSEQPSQTDLTSQAADTTTEAQPPADKPTASTPEPLATMPVNDATENPEPKDSKPSVPLATHQHLASSTAETSSVTDKASPKLDQPTISPTPSPQAAPLVTEPATTPAVSVPEPQLDKPEPKTPLVTESTVAPAVAVPEPKLDKPEPNTPLATVSQISPAVSVPDTKPQAPEPQIATPSNLPQEGAKLQTPGIAPKVQTPPRVSFSDEEATAARAEASGSSVQPAPATSGWRYSVGAVKGRKTSTEHDRRSVSDNPPLPNTRSPEPSADEHHEESSPRAKRRSGIFSKIKSALSPHKKNGYSSGSPGGGGNKRNSLGRTATISRE
ncbi:uncharacterized protein PGTG_13375 [Puccinia graminis f. sp. tritici CRL 75-36-700-3]|uniref:AMP-activated protein kinase glycogen-binding domain-containing protein n=1 Tax=Puccinia graminis f. sp. tritici (strain CRL 75-36-700-3 / race SCCL) TaxID=418459 RepID=E3KS81_PUCGT|nr:uncharacterized protein PGTG_13375 [Puccinia graminis f. sp. tritici CRL 75-36-700-3]EFP87156.2 hypothetical protein PGTG_13375 [Puccinia graminis f. sp. tritici CRL 75-36-700-3]